MSEPRVADTAMHRTLTESDYLPQVEPPRDEAAPDDPVVDRLSPCPPHCPHCGQWVGVSPHQHPSG